MTVLVMSYLVIGLVTFSVDSRVNFGHLYFTKNQSLLSSVLSNLLT